MLRSFQESASANALTCLLEFFIFGTRGDQRRRRHNLTLDMGHNKGFGHGLEICAHDEMVVYFPDTSAYIVM